MASAIGYLFKRTVACGSRFPPKTILDSRRSIFRQIERCFKTGHRRGTRPGDVQIEGVQVESQPVSPKSLWKPFLFTVTFSTGSIAAASIWQYENMRSRAYSIIKKFKFQQVQKKAGLWRQEFNQQWNSLSEDQKLFVPICVLNVIVYGLWKVPRFQPVMLKYFCSNPASKAICWPMVLSTFSHHSGFHLLANMFVLHSFSAGIINTMGKEQFLGMYLAGGAFSSFTSYVHKILSKQPSFSLGASGAIMAVVGYVCSQYPETQLSIIFLPMYTFSAALGLKALLSFDAAGIIFKWKFFDHAAHIGGALLGISWCYWGNEYIWQRREPLLQFWHKLREGGSTR